MKTKREKHIVKLSFKETSFWCLIFSFYYLPIQCQEIIYAIPSQTLSQCNQLKNYYGNDSLRKVVVSTFSISQQITLGEYKQYLNDIRRDSSFAFYKSQWPDSNIAAKETLEKYMTEVLYERYPVVGISWFKVMNYCRWRTLKETSDSIRFVYRLPFYSEWVAAQTYLSEQAIKNDFNKSNSDWLLSEYSESYYGFVDKNGTSPYDHFYLPRANDSKVLTRMRYIGDSFLQQSVTFANKTYYYASEGLLDVSFRLVKEPYDRTNKKSMAESMLTYYRIIK